MIEQVSLEAFRPISGNHAIFKTMPQPVKRVFRRFEKPILREELVRRRADGILPK